MKQKKYLSENFYGSLPCGGGNGRGKRFIKTLALLGTASFLLLAAACGNGDVAASGKDGKEAAQEAVDVDLTELNSTMVYSEVYNMMVTPADYEGKTVKMKGRFSVYHDEENNKDYFACLISDATACCSQGMEFELEGGHKYPDDYPEAEEEVTVVGVFRTYEENGNQYCHLEEARFL